MAGHTRGLFGRVIEVKGHGGNPARQRPSSRPTVARVVSSIEETGLDERSWNALAGLGINTVFQTYQWHRSWLATYGRLYEPSFVTVSDGTSITGVAPLIVEDTAARGRVVRFVGDGRADYCDLLAAGNVSTVAAMVRELCARKDWDILDLKNIPSESASAGVLQAVCQEAGYSVLVHDHLVCPTLLLHGHEPEASRILNKPSLRRRQNYFERLGCLSFRTLSAASDIEPQLDAFFEQHIARWSASRTPSLFLVQANRDFYYELTRQLDGTSWLAFSLVELDGRPIAMHYGFDYNDTLFWYKPSFDPAFAAHSPGLVLVRHLIRRAMEDGRRELDFTIGDESFKRRFTNLVRKTVRIRVYRDPTRYALERSRLAMVAAFKRATASVRRPA